MQRSGVEKIAKRLWQTYDRRPCSSKRPGGPCARQIARDLPTYNTRAAMKPQKFACTIEQIGRFD
jgi:hypothetical protein